MKEAIVSAGPKVHIVDSPIPIPEPDQVVIKVVVSGSNPNDWKMPLPTMGKSWNPGDDIAGVVHSVGSNVVEFKRGDRVAAFHEISAPGGSYAEYAVSWDHTTFHIPKKTTFEGQRQSCLRIFHTNSHLEAATIPLSAYTAAYGLYQCLGLPPPWRPATTSIPVIIYGAASAVGSFAIQLARQSNTHPLICIAGRGIPHVEELIDKTKGDIVLDYRNGHSQLVQDLQSALRTSGAIHHAFDGVSEHGSFQNICQVLSPTGKIALITPFGDYSAIPASIEKSNIFAGTAHRRMDPDPWQQKTGMQTGNEEFAMAFFHYIARGLQRGYLKGHPYQVVPGGLAGVQECLQSLKDGKASALKYVVRIGETECVLRGNGELD